MILLQEDCYLTTCYIHGIKTSNIKIISQINNTILNCIVFRFKNKNKIYIYLFEWFQKKTYEQFVLASHAHFGIVTMLFYITLLEPVICVSTVKFYFITMKQFLKG